MKHRKSLLILLLIFALTACTQPTAAPSATLPPPTRTPAPTASATASATPVPPTATPSPVPTLTPTPTATPPPVRLVQWAEWELDRISSAAWLPDSQSIVFSGYEAPEWGDPRTYRYTIDPLQQSWQIDDVGYSLAVNPDGSVIAGDGGLGLTLWDAQSGQVIRGPYGGYAGSGSSFPAFLPDGPGLLVGQTGFYYMGSSETQITLWDYEQSEYDPVSESLMIESDGWMADMAISPDGELLTAALDNLLGEDGLEHSQVAIWDLATNSQRCTILGDDFALSPTEKIVAVSNYRFEGSIGGSREKDDLILYDTDTCQPLRTIYQSSYIADFAYSPDGKTLALAIPFGDDTYSIILVDAATGELLYEQRGLWNGIWQLTFSPDGKYLLSIENYGTQSKLHIWQVILAPGP